MCWAVNKPIAPLAKSSPVGVPSLWVLLEEVGSWVHQHCCGRWRPWTWACTHMQPTVKTTDEYGIMFTRKLSDVHSEGLSLACDLSGEGSDVRRCTDKIASYQKHRLRLLSPVASDSAQIWTVTLMHNQSDVLMIRETVCQHCPDPKRWSITH